MHGGHSPNPALLRRLAAVASLLVGTAAPAIAANSTSADTTAQSAQERQPQDIVVTAPPLFRDVRPERNLDEQGIASYGVSTVDDLISELESELDSDEEPVFVVNGQRVYDLDDIGSYPVEVIKQLQVLPRGAAPLVGGSPTQRVFNLTLSRKMRSAIVTVAPRLATEGEWHAVRGEAILTSIDGRRRGNVALRVRDESALLESQRGIIQPNATIPFATSGNVIAYPDLSGEIDPLLSDAAGEMVTVAPIPSNSDPTLADFAAQGGAPNFTDAGGFRTLRPALRSYDFNATYTTPLTNWLTSTATLRLGRSTSRSLIGLATGIFTLGPANPASPFSVPVALAIAGEDPLHSRYRRESGEGNTTLTATLGGRWSAALNAKHSEVRELTRTQGSESFAAVPLDDSINPFAIDLGDLIAVSTDRATSRYRTTTTQLTFTGPLLHLAAGDMMSTLETRVGWYGIRSESSFFGQSTRIHRNEQAIRGLVDIPLASRRNGFLPEIGELSASAEYARQHLSDSGGAYRSALALSWEPRDAVSFRASFEKAKVPAPIEFLGAATTVTPFARIFDPLTGETVDVTLISGGNRNLKPTTSETRRLSTILRLVPSLGLQLNGEYSDVRSRNFVSGLPPASEAIMLAFPEQFIRDSDGTLIEVDLRPVNFARQRQQRLRWGFSLNAPIGGGAKPSFAPAAVGDSEESAEQAAVAAAASAISHPPTRLQLTVNHTIVLKDEILIRPGLDPVDLLSGGAIGIAGGRVRHQLDATAVITSGGTGIRIGAAWLGASTLQARIDGLDERLRFSPLLTFNLRAFADARRIFPASALANGARISLIVTNLTNQRQRVRDPFGATPLQYQPAYRDPLGRTIELEIRKVF